MAPHHGARPWRGLADTHGMAGLWGRQSYNLPVAPVHSGLRHITHQYGSARTVPRSMSWRHRTQAWPDGRRRAYDLGIELFRGFARSTAGKRLVPATGHQGGAPRRGLLRRVAVVHPTGSPVCARTGLAELTRSSRRNGLVPAVLRPPDGRFAQATFCAAVLMRKTGR